MGRESGCCLVVERNRYLLPDVGAVGGITLDNLLAVGDCRCIVGVVHEGAYVGCVDEDRAFCISAVSPKAMVAGL